MIARSRWPRRLAIGVAIVLVTCSPAFAIQYNPIENHGETECALLLDGPGRSSQLDYNLNTLRGTFGYRGSNTCITYDAVNQAYINARKRIQVAQPQGPWAAPDVATVGELLLDITIQLAKTYGLTYEDVEKGLPLIDTSKTLIREVCPPYLANVECRPGKYRRYDGLCTNLQHPTWGAINTPFTRLVGPLFADGMTAPRISVTGNQLPLSRIVSRTMHPDEGFHDHAGTVMIVAWGQFMDHDYTLTATPLDPLNKNEPEECCNRPPHLKNPYCMEIPIPEDDYFYRLTDVRCMDFVRAFPAVRPGCRLGSRIPYNTLTGVIDGNTIYGVTEKFARHLRSGFGGLLRMNPAFNEYGLKDLLPLKLDIPDEGCTRPNRSMFCFEAGEIRVNEQLILTCMHTLMAREHNRVAKGLAQVNPHWDDETLYQEARRIVIGEIQHITYNEFLPILLGKEVMEKFGLLTQKEGYWDGYDPEVNPSVIDAFAAAAFRFGHSLLPTAVERWSKAHKFIASRRLSDLIRRPYDLYRAGVMDEYFMGLMNQVAQAMDDSVTQEVTNHLFKKPGKRFGMDLASFNMQRGREFGLPGYMEFRKFCGLPGAENFDELLGSMPNTTIKRYASIYQHPSDVDLWSGGVSERPLPGSMVGPTFACIIATQFSYSRRGDRFWYELGNQPSSFTPEQLAEIRKVKLSRVICDNTDLIDTVQVYPLVLPDHEINPRVPCKSGILPSIDFSKWADYSGVHHGASAQSNNIPFDLDPEKTSKGIVTFFAAVSPAEKLDTPPAISVEDSHAIEMTEAVIIDDRPNPNKTEAPENRTNHTVVKRHVSLRVKRSDEEVDEDDEGQLPINPDDDDGFVDIEDDAPYEFIQSPDDHDDITVDPNDVVEQTEDAGEHDDNDHPHDEDANAVLDVSDDLESDDPAVFHTALPPVQEITVHKNTKLVNKPKKSRHTFHDRSAPKESVQFKVHQTDHSTVTRPKAKHSQYRHQDIYDINWAGRHKRPTYERNSQKTFTSHPSASQLLSPQTSQGFVVKRDPGSAEGVDHHKKIRTNEKARTDVRYSRTTPTVRKKETSVLAIDESYKSRGMKPPRWSSSFIRFEEPDSPLLSSGFGEHLPSDPVDDHPISFPNEEIAEPTISALGLPYASTARPSLSSTPAYNPGRNFPEKEDAKMKRITDEIDKILMENFDFRSTFNSPRKSYHPNRLPPQVSDRESQLDEPESEKVDETGDNRQRRPNDEENEEETTKEQRKEGEDVGEHEDAPPKRDEEESTAKNEEGTKGEKQNNGNGGASVEQQEEAPPQKEDRENADEGEHESTTTESNGVTGGETTDRGNDNSGVEDPRTDRGPVRFQVADVREDNPTKKKTKMKCIPVSEEESVTEKETVVKEEDGKENAAVEEDKGSAVDGETKEPERVQEDVQTEDPETNERTTVKQDEESDKREEEKSNIEDGTKHDGESDRKEEEAPEDGSKHDEEPESKIEKVVQKEEGPTPEERLERKEEASIKKSPSRDDKPNTEGKKTDVENASLHDDKPRKEDEKSNIEHLKVKPKEEKDEYFSEEYSRKGGHDYQDFQSHRHKETDNQLHKHHGREEGGHDHQQKHENSHNKHDQGSKLKGRNQGASGEFQNQHLGDQQSQLQNEDHARQESYGERYRTTDKEQEDNLKKQDDSKYERNKNYRQSGKHLGTNSVDKIPIIEIFHGVPNVAYSEHSNYLDQPNRVTSTTHETPYTSPYSFSTTPNPNQLRVETNRQESPVRSHLSLHPNPRQQSYELPNSTPPGSLISTVANHLPITSTTLPFTTQEHLLTTTPNHQPIAASTPNPPTTTLHDHLVITTHDHLPLISTQDSLLTTTTPHDHLLSTTPNHLITSTPLEVRVSFQEDPIATTHQPRQIEATESEHISTTTASSKIIGLLDKQRNTQHNELEKQREDADYQLNKQKKQLNQDIEGLNPANLVSPETSATDKRNKQQLDWQDYQQQLYYPKPSPKPQGFPPFITVESGKRRPPILVEDVDYRELMDIRDQRVVHSNQDSELDRPTGRYYV